MQIHVITFDKISPTLLRRSSTARCSTVHKMLPAAEQNMDKGSHAPSNMHVLFARWVLSWRLHLHHCRRTATEKHKQTRAVGRRGQPPPHLLLEQATFRQRQPLALAAPSLDFGRWLLGSPLQSLALTATSTTSVKLVCFIDRRQDRIFLQNGFLS